MVSRKSPTWKHSRAKAHLKRCWVCRMRFKADLRAHILLHTLGFLGTCFIVLYILYGLLFGQNY